MEQVLSQDDSKVRALQLLTVAWMLLELVIAIRSGFHAHSVALIAFGADSAIELISAIVVLRRFTVGAHEEELAAKISAFLLCALAIYIVAGGAYALWPGAAQEAAPSVVGIALLLAAAFVMPLLGRAKRRLATQTHSRSLGADAAQSNLCAYMSWITLAGLSVNFWFHLPWADSVAALALLPIVLKEANEARRGNCCDCC